MNIITVISLLLFAFMAIVSFVFWKLTTLEMEEYKIELRIVKTKILGLESKLTELEERTDKGLF